MRANARLVMYVKSSKLNSRNRHPCRFCSPAPASGYFWKKSFISCSLISVANFFVTVGMSEPRYRSFKVNLSTRYSHSFLTKSQTMGSPTLLYEM